MRRPVIPALVAVVALLLLVDFVVVNDSLGSIAAVVVEAVILVAAGASLAAAGALAARRAADLWRRRGDPVGATLVLVGIGAMLVAGLRPGAGGAGSPEVRWLVAALLLPLGATLFGLLFVTTLAAARRALDGHGRDAAIVVAVAIVTLVLLLPLGGEAGLLLAAASAWALDGPIGAVFRGVLIGIAIAASLLAARVMLGVGPSDD